MVIAVDFDGTLCTSKFPDIGEPKLEIIEKVKKLKAKGAELILWTCRNGDSLKEAVDFCSNYGLEFDYINSPARKFTEMFPYNDTRKICADFYLDDKNITLKDFLNWEEK